MALLSVDKPSGYIIEQEEANRVVIKYVKQWFCINSEQNVKIR